MRVGKQQLPCREKGGKEVRGSFSCSKSTTEGTAGEKGRRSAGRGSACGLSKERKITGAEQEAKGPLSPGAEVGEWDRGYEREGKGTSWSRRSLVSGRKGGDAPSRRSCPANAP